MPFTLRKFNRMWLLGVLALLLAGGGLVWADSDDDDLPPASTASPITGKVVVLSQRRDALFVHLDANGDGLGDLWGRLERKTQIVDPSGNPQPITAIAVGMPLTITHYKVRHGYYKAYRVMVGTAGPSASGRQPLQGKVAQVFRFGDDLFVRLDINGEGQMDVRVKIKRNAIIADPQGNRLGFEAIQPGMPLTLIAYKPDDDGYYEAWHIIVRKMAAPAPAGRPLQGIVLEVIPFGNSLFVRLDADEDGQEDYPVKIDKNTVIVDPQSKPLDRSAIKKGVKLTVTHYQPKNGSYEAKRVALSRDG